MRSDSFMEPNCAFRCQFEEKNEKNMSSSSENNYVLVIPTDEDDDVEIEEDESFIEYALRSLESGVQFNHSTVRHREECSGENSTILQTNPDSRVLSHPHVQMIEESENWESIEPMNIDPAELDDDIEMLEVGCDEETQFDIGMSNFDAATTDELLENLRILILMLLMTPRSLRRT
jgi:hypothetical protein